MRLHELFEQIDPKEANEVLLSLKATNDPAATYFPMTVQNPLHKTIDSAQRAAEQMARADLAKKSEAERKRIELQRQRIRAQSVKKDDQVSKDDKKKPQFKGAADTAKAELKGALGKIQKAWQRGTAIADKYTKATKS